MSIAELREKLKGYIDDADEAHLSAIYVLVENDIVNRSDIYDEATMKMLYERRERHRQGISKSYSAEESLDIIRAHGK